jgi:hypothetical protein
MARIIIFFFLTITGCVNFGAPEAPYPAPPTEKWVSADRDGIAAMDIGLLTRATEYYNKQQSAGDDWADQAQGCLNRVDDFNDAAGSLGFQPAFLAGISLKESMCADIEGTTDDHGYMQIASVSRAHQLCAKDALGIEIDKLDYKRSDEHNIMLGTCVIDEYERRLGSRALGLYAYRHGVQGTRDASRNGRTPVSELSGDHTYKTMASIAFMAMLLDGEDPPTRIARLTHTHIPGWYPAGDLKLVQIAP